MKDDRSRAPDGVVSRGGKSMAKKKIKGKGFFIAGIVLAALAAGIIGIFAYKATAARGNFALRVSEMGSSEVNSCHH
ncbi:hypothetical protein MASR2M78_26550 [Treponema sp.]